MNATKYSTSVRSGGRVELEMVDAPEGTRIEVIVLVPSDTDDPSAPLAAASESSMAFWDNPIDDEVWNADE